MSAETYWLCRITPRSDIGYRQFVDLGGLDPYGQHEALWKLFDIPREQNRKRAEFLFRAEQQDDLPVFYMLSRQVPEDGAGLWRIEPKRYAPDIREGDRLAFKLRVNPVVTRPGQSGGRSKRHDVVMDAKSRLNWKDMPEAERLSVGQLAHDAGDRWLRGREQRLGCRFEQGTLQVAGYRTWRQHNGKGIALSTLDFDGHLTVSDAEKFKNALVLGIGSAKAFGCGLMLVRRL